MKQEIVKKQNQKDDININQKPKIYYKNRSHFTINHYGPSDENYKLFGVIYR